MRGVRERDLSPVRSTNTDASDVVLVDVNADRGIHKMPLVIFNCEDVLTAETAFTPFVIVSTLLSLGFITFSVLLRIRIAGKTEISWIVVVIPLIVTLLIIYSLFLFSLYRRLLQVDHGVPMSSKWHFTIFPAIASTGVLITVLYALIYAAIGLDDHETLSGSFLLSPLLVVFFCICISLQFCIRSDIFDRSIGIYTFETVLILRIVQIFLFAFVLSLVFIVVHLDLLNVSWTICFLPLLIHSFCSVGFSAYHLISPSTLDESSREIDCCAYFGTVTPSKAVYIPLLLCNLNLLLLELFLALCLDISTSLALLDLLLVFMILLPFSLIFLLTCSSCVVFVSNDPYRYNF